MGQRDLDCILDDCDYPMNKRMDSEEQTVSVSDDAELWMLNWKMYNLGAYTRKRNYAFWTFFQEMKKTLHLTFKRSYEWLLYPSITYNLNVTDGFWRHFGAKSLGWTLNMVSSRFWMQLTAVLLDRIRQTELNHRKTPNSARSGCIRFCTQASRLLYYNGS